MFSYITTLATISCLLIHKFTFVVVSSSLMSECEAGLGAGFLFYMFLILLVDPVSLHISYCHSPIPS